MFIIQFMLFQVRKRRRFIGKHKFGFHGGFVGAGTDAVPARTISEHKADGFYQNGFAGARFARQSRKARIENDIGLVDQRYIGNL